MMFGTTCLLVLVMLLVWNLNVFLVAIFFLFFGFVDMVYFSSNLNKVSQPHDAEHEQFISASCNHQSLSLEEESLGLASCQVPRADCTQGSGMASKQELSAA